MTNLFKVTRRTDLQMKFNTKRFSWKTGTWPAVWAPLSSKTVSSIRRISLSQSSSLKWMALPFLKGHKPTSSSETTNTRTSITWRWMSQVLRFMRKATEDQLRKKTDSCSWMRRWHRASLPMKVMLSMKSLGQGMKTIAGATIRNNRGIQTSESSTLMRSCRVSNSWGRLESKRRNKEKEFQSLPMYWVRKARTILPDFMGRHKDKHMN